MIQSYSGHESRKSLEIYSKLAITNAQQEYNEVINKFPHIIISTLRVVSASLVLPLLKRG
ncbi:hypothetical protein [Paenibacillus jiagnxiensis]|uniref:hypothetical protein n=1 Tax=Paenibacillus jiagnxiensis TaxID=3228926 RepID=UPI00339E1159